MSVTAEEMVVMQEQLAKGNLVGEEAEVAQKALEEATKAAEEEAAKKKAEEEKAALEKMTDEEKAAAEAKAKEAEEAEALKAKEKEEADAKAAYEKLSDEEKAEADKKAETEAEAAKEAERDKRNKNIKIPKFRLDAATARARKAEEERDALALKLAEAEKAKANKDELSPAEKHEATLAEIDIKLAEAMKEGDATTVSTLMGESRSVERKFQSANNEVKLQEVSSNTTAQVNETTLINNILDQLEKQFPMFDESSDDYNADANADVLKMQKGLIAAGDSAADALVEAVNMVLPKYGIIDEETKKEGDDDDGQKAKAAEKAAADKKKQVEKNLKDAGKQPPNMDDAGDDSDAAGANSDMPNVLDLTDAEYDALPEATRKKMRGDDF